MNPFIPIQPGTDPAQQIAIINKNFGELQNESVKKLYKDSSGTNRIFIDATVPVIKISEAGIDVTTASNDQLTFNSAQNVFKVVATGTTVIDKPSNDALGASPVIPHGLGYVPAVIAFVQLDASSQVPIPYVKPDSAGLVAQSIYYTVTSTDIQFGEDAPNLGPGSPYTIAQSLNVKYYLLQETAI